ncbi:helix-turn-helix domain-containing protein [Pseudofrankia sp. BMG5.37]|uniref:helix-turn-helix domain-containing protein n=1 Tax=Pseudofrankia sp. BMG5.37 TaxID=3050035 RepID=UPI00289466EB|nr:helix-turn-helix domain-containing protein [Pseudofrankia sp. BMG5.37]MDT3446957.1 helix-turn-helix domain-containing protein [Pseudofrankia sp. BMG5.37]
MRRLEGAVLTVEADVVSVERRLAAGGLACPGCGGVLAPWGRSTSRPLRDLDWAVLWLRPRRARCSGCGHTHVLLPVVALLRRADLAVVVWAGLLAAAAGKGARRVAALLGRPRSTVRGWLRRFAGRSEAVRRVFTGLLVAVGVDAVVPAPAGSPVADAVAAVAGAAVVAGARWALLGVVAPWAGVS